MGKTLDILRNKNFFLLWIGQIISQFGDRLNQIALISLVFDKTPGSTMQLAKVLFFTVIPVFIIGPVAGVYVDRWNRKVTMIFADIMRGLLVILLPLSLKYMPDAFLPVYIIIFLIYSITRFFLPSRLAILPDLVDNKDLIAANSLMATTRLISTMVGLALAGMIVRKIGYSGGFYLDAASFIGSAILLCFKSGIKFKKPDFLKRGSFSSELKEGFISLWMNPAGRLATIVTFILMGAIGAVFVVIVVFLQEAFHISQVVQQIGWLATILGIGLFLGILAFGEYGHKFSRKGIIFFSFISSGIIVVLFAFSVDRTGSFWTAAIISALLGFSAAPLVVLPNTLINEAIPAESGGKVFSSLDVVIHLPFLICMLITAKLAEEMPKMWILAAVGAILALLGLAGLSHRKIINTEAVK
ncbi:MAG: MFS transporter [Candidatus Omnitrophica bacterium]|nr:MFS transporter [Candidatus Omnitrophota bacterium]